MEKSFEEKLNELVDEHVSNGGDRDEMVSALELKLMALKEAE